MNYWTDLKRVAAPLDTVISLAEAKAHLNVFHDDDDALITSLIETAISYIEGPNGIGVAMLTQTWRKSMNGFGCSAISIPLGPVSEIVSITYGGETLNPDTYDVDLDREPCVIVRAPNASWPAVTSRPGLVKVTFKAGHGSDPDDVPAVLKHAVKLLVGHYYADRGDEECEVPMGVHNLLQKYRAAL